ncbi:MAG: leucine-rich repeat domain-containing protein [Clostridia bacterium]|nr:leucine-rich repeat domain-containing protein [Clostridia bacterium]
MKKSIAILLVLCTLVAVLSVGVLPVSAASGVIGKCTWSLEGTMLTIGGNGGTGAVYSSPWGTNVTRLVIKSGVTAIDYTLFSLFPKLSEIVVENGNPRLKTVDGVLFNKDMTVLLHYPAQKAGRSYTVPSTVTEIGACAFFKNAKLVDITLPDGLEHVRYKAFAHSVCASTTKNFYEGGVYVDNCLVDLVDKNIQELKVREGTRVIADCAAISAPRLEDVFLPEGLRTIESNAFSWCSKMQYISIPYSVTHIGNDAFYDCYSLELVFYRGGESDEEDMYIDSQGNADLMGAEWIYNACYESANHTWGDYYVTKASTCFKSGVTEHACEVCKTKEAEIIPAHHTFEREYAMVTKPAGLFKSGELSYWCSGCGEERNEEIPMVLPTKDEQAAIAFALYFVLLLG